MKMSFSKTEQVPTPVEGVTVETTTTAVPAAEAPASEPKAESIPTRPASEQTTTAVARRETSDHAIFDDNNIGFEDIVLPRINIVQKVGDLSNVFTPGEIVLNQSLVIHTPASQKGAGDPPISLTVLGFKKTIFVEKVEGGALGDIARSEEEIVRKGGTLDYKEWKQSEKDAKENAGTKPLRYFQRMATALVLVEKPGNVADPDQTIFPYECEGRFYTLALWSMKGTAYTNGAKNIFTHRKIGHLRTVTLPTGEKRGGYPTNSYTLSTKLENYFGNFAHIPVLKPGPKNTEAFRSFVNSILGLE